MVHVHASQVLNWRVITDYVAFQFADTEVIRPLGIDHPIVTENQSWQYTEFPVPYQAWHLITFLWGNVNFKESFEMMKMYLCEKVSKVQADKWHVEFKWNNSISRFLRHSKFIETNFSE